MLLFSLYLCPATVNAGDDAGQVATDRRADADSGNSADTRGSDDGSDADEPKASGGMTQIQWPAGPDISAAGAIVVEASSGSILYAKNIYDTFYPASTTKILTTLVALENSELNEIVTVSYAADNYVSKTSSRMGLVEGEQVTMEQALYGIMLESGNEATFAVGEHVGGEEVLQLLLDLQEAVVEVLFSVFVLVVVEGVGGNVICLQP